jgi:hypothetical protein
VAVATDLVKDDVPEVGWEGRGLLGVFVNVGHVLRPHLLMQQRGRIIIILITTPVMQQRGRIIRRTAVDRDDDPRVGAQGYELS